MAKIYPVIPTAEQSWYIAGTAPTGSVTGSAANGVSNLQSFINSVIAANNNDGNGLVTTGIMTSGTTGGLELYDQKIQVNGQTLNVSVSFANWNNSYMTSTSPANVSNTFIDGNGRECVTYTFNLYNPNLPAGGRNLPSFSIKVPISQQSLFENNVL